MCLPAAAAVAVGLAVAGTAVSTITQIQTAKAQNKAINAQNDIAQKQIDETTSAQINDRLREARREQGRILAAAGESGLSTTSGNVEGLLMDSAMQASLADQRSLANRESQKVATATEAQSKLQAYPSTLGAGLQIGLAGAKAYFGQQAQSTAKQRANG